MNSTSLLYKVLTDGLTYLNLRSPGPQAGESESDDNLDARYPADLDDEVDSGDEGGKGDGGGEGGGGGGAAGVLIASAMK